MSRVVFDRMGQLGKFDVCTSVPLSCGHSLPKFLGVES